MVEIKKIAIDINGKELELTIEEARRLFVELQSLFDKEQQFPWIHPIMRQLTPYCPPVWSGTVTGDPLPILPVKVYCYGENKV